MLDNGIPRRCLQDYILFQSEHTNPEEKPFLSSILNYYFPKESILRKPQVPSSWQSRRPISSRHSRCRLGHIFSGIQEEDYRVNTNVKKMNSGKYQRNLKALPLPSNSTAKWILNPTLAARDQLFQNGHEKYLTNQDYENTFTKI